MNIDFSHFTLQTSLSYTTKGERVPMQPSPLTPAGSNQYIVPLTTYRLNYIETSVNALYNIHVAPFAVIQLGGGPYLADGLSASYTIGGVKHAATFGNDPGVVGFKYKNPDYGVNFLGGVKLKNKVLIDFGYSIGLANVYYGSKMQNRLLSISAGYLFR